MEKSNKIVQDFIFDTILGAKEYDKDEGYFSTYELKSNPEIWLQLTPDCLNIYYPFVENPIEKLKELGLDYSCFEISCWEEKLFLTLDFKTTNHNEISQFIVNYFLKVFNIKISHDTFSYTSYEDYPDSDYEDLL